MMPDGEARSAVSSMSSFGSRTDVGYVRETNEDSLLVAPPLYVVCDGMGGHEAGEIASEIAVSTISSNAPSIASASGLGRAVEQANLQIIRAANDGYGRPGMGTTCTAAMLEGEDLVIAQVGDSRAYLLHDGELQQLTRDHSVVADLVEAGEITKEEARTHQWRSYITRALGLEPNTKPDLYEIEVAESDRLMLCSDGLYSVVEDSTIQRIMREVPDPQRCADALVDAALKGGGIDNVTVVVVNIAGDRARRVRKTAIKGKVTAVTIILLLLLIIGGAYGGFAYWVDNSAYLTEEDGRVAIYKGVPGDLFGMTFSSLEEVTEVSIDDLQPGTAQRLIQGEIRCDSLDDARGLVQEYSDEISAAAAAKSDKLKAGSSDSSAAEGATSGNSSSSSTGSSAGSSSASSSEEARGR